MILQDTDVKEGYDRVQGKTWPSTTTQNILLNYLHISTTVYAYRVSVCTSHYN